MYSLAPVRVAMTITGTCVRSRSRDAAVLAPMPSQKEAKKDSTERSAADGPFGIEASGCTTPERVSPVDWPAICRAASDTAVSSTLS